MWWLIFSFCSGLDACLQPNQAVAHPPFIEELFTFATGKDPAGYTLLTIKDLSRVMGKRRAESKATNKTYALHLAHKFFASAKWVVSLLLEDELTFI